MSATDAATLGTSKRRALQLLVIGQAVIGTAAWATLIAVQTKASYDLGEGPLYLSAVALAWGAPTLVLSPLVGRAIDSAGPRVVGLVGTVVSIVASLGLIVMSSSPLLLWAVTLVGGVARAFTQPAVDSMPSRLPGGVEQVKASIWLGFATSVPIVAGPAFAAMFIAAGGTTSAFVFNTFAYLLGLLIFVRLRTVPLDDVAGAEGEAEPRGARAWRGREVSIILGMTLVVWISYGAFSPLEVLYVQKVLDQPASTFAAIEIVFGAGLLASTFAIARFDWLLSHRRTLPLAVLFVGAAEVLYIATDQVALAFAGVCCWGLAAGVFGPACRLVLLNRTPAEYHGRAMASWRGIQSFGSLAPPVVSGALASVVGIQPTLVGFAAVVLATGLVALLLMPGRTPVTTTSTVHDAER